MTFRPRCCFSMRRKGASILMMVCCWFIGCDKLPERPQLDKPLKSRAAEEAEQARIQTIESPQDPFKGDWESWYAYYINNSKIGFSYVKAEQQKYFASSNGAAKVQYTQEDQIIFRRGRSTFIQHLSQKSTETNVGRIVNFDSELHVGPIVTQYNGSRSSSDQPLVVKTTRGSMRKGSRIPNKNTHRGLAAVEQSLRRNPMSAKEKRTLEVLLPIQYKIASVEMLCVGMASVALLDGEYHKLLEIVTSEKIGEDKISEQVIWTDAEGIIQKMLRPGIGVVAYRTEKEVALENVADVGDVIGATRLDVTGTVEKPGQAKQAAFVVSPTAAIRKAGSKIAIPTGPGQFVRKMDDGTFQVFVSQIAKEAPKAFEAFQLQPVEEDSKPNAIITSSDSRIVQIAKLTGEMKPMETTMDLVRATNQLLDRVGTSKSLMPASSIARETFGDSTHFSILLAALLRNKGIPSRIAAGVVFDADDETDPPTMNYQLWTIAYVDGRWIALDAMKGGMASSDRLMLASTNFSGGNEYNFVANVLASMGQIDVQVQAATY